MRANVIVQNLISGECVKTITKRLSEIEGLTEIAVDKAASKVSFNYNSENAAFSVIEKLKCLGFPSIDDRNYMMKKPKSMANHAGEELTI